LKKDLTEANEKIIQLEEELYEAKNMSNELLDKLKFAEE
jgi:hypothetical protein